MRAGKPIFQRKRERTFVGIILPIFFYESLLLVVFPVDQDIPAYFLLTTTQPIE